MGPDDAEPLDATGDGTEAELERPKHRAARVPRQRRRVTTDAVPGTDPAPANEPPRHIASENDDRLRADKPPHWG